MEAIESTQRITLPTPELVGETSEETVDRIRAYRKEV
jgi:hypothetical protein